MINNDLLLPIMARFQNSEELCENEKTIILDCLDFVSRLSGYVKAYNVAKGNEKTILLETIKSMVEISTVEAL